MFRFDATSEILKVPPFVFLFFSANFSIVMWSKERSSTLSIISNGRNNTKLFKSVFFLYIHPLYEVVSRFKTNFGSYYLKIASSKKGASVLKMSNAPNGLGFLGHKLMFLRRVQTFHQRFNSLCDGSFPTRVFFVVSFGRVFGSCKMDFANLFLDDCWLLFL